MFEWLIQNLGSILILTVVLAIVTVIVILRIRAKKKGETGCGCGCSSCPGRFTCHSNKQEENKKKKVWRADLLARPFNLFQNFSICIDKGKLGVVLLL